MSKEVKDNYIIFRVTKKEKDSLTRLAKGTRKLSQYIRKVLGLDK